MSESRTGWQTNNKYLAHCCEAPLAGLELEPDGLTIRPRGSEYNHASSVT